VVFLEGVYLPPTKGISRVARGLLLPVSERWPTRRPRR